MLLIGDTLKTVSTLLTIRWAAFNSREITDNWNNFAFERGSIIVHNQDELPIFILFLF